MVLHIHRHLLARLAMQHCEGATHLHRLRLPHARGTDAHAQERTDDAVLVVFAPEVVVEDGEEGNGVDRYCCWCSAVNSFSVSFYI